MGEVTTVRTMYCHKPIGYVELDKFGEVEVSKVKVGKVGKVEAGKACKVEVGKIVKIYVGKLGTAQLDNLDKPTSSNGLEQHVGTNAQKLNNSATKRQRKL